MIPTIGRIVHYTLRDEEAAKQNQRRADTTDHLEWHRTERTGSQCHVGNHLEGGQVYPMMITRVWGDVEGSAVQGQVFLDGNDVLWVTSVTEGEGPGAWFVPPRV